MTRKTARCAPAWLPSRLRERRSETFAGTPGLKFVKGVLRMAVSKLPRRQSERRHNAIYDISVAFFHAGFGEREKTVAVRLPRDVAGADKAALLQGAIYGTRLASQLWQEKTCKDTTAFGFRRSATNASCYYSEGLGVSLQRTVAIPSWRASRRAWGDVDDFMLATYQTKVLPTVGLGAAVEGKCLNRRITWGETGFNTEADPKHVDRIVRELKPGDEKVEPVATPGTKAMRLVANIADLLDNASAETYMLLVGVARHIAQYIVGVLARKLSTPSDDDFNVLRRLGRYLAGARSLVIDYVYQDIEQAQLPVEVGSDRAGCPRTRRITTGGVLYVGKHALCSCSVLQ